MRKTKRLFCFVAGGPAGRGASGQAADASPAKELREGESAVFQAEAPEDGAYVLEIDYTPAKGRTASPEADITVEGAGTLGPASGVSPHLAGYPSWNPVCHRLPRQ